MLLVVADTSPIRYLLQIGQIELLRRLFAEVILPVPVAAELGHRSAPAAVQSWMNRLPGWVAVLPVTDIDDPALAALDPGEKSAITLGLSLNADLILIDERKGTAAALSKGFTVTGTLGVLDLAAERGFVDLREALERLKQTNFRYPPTLLAALLKKHAR